MPKPKHPPSPAVGGGNHPGHLLERAALAMRMQRFGEAEQLAAEMLGPSRTDLAAAMILAQALIGQNRGGGGDRPAGKGVAPQR